MKPGNLLELKPHRTLTAYYQLLTPNQYRDQLQTRGTFSNVVQIEPFSILLYIENIEWANQTWCKILYHDNICYLHKASINKYNFRTLDAPLFEAM